MADRNEILQKVNVIFREVLENASIVLTESTTGDDVVEWDSITHLELIMAIEKEFKIRFSASEIINFGNIGELCDGIIGKLKS